MSWVRDQARVSVSTIEKRNEVLEDQDKSGELAVIAQISRLLQLQLQLQLLISLI